MVGPRSTSDYSKTEQELAEIADSLASLLSERDVVATRMRSKGATLRVIATASRMTPEGVSKLIKRCARSSDAVLDVGFAREDAT